MRASVLVGRKPGSSATTAASPNPWFKTVPGWTITPDHTSHPADCRRAQTAWIAHGYAAPAGLKRLKLTA
eukprot:6431188-Pyramimonas_sp.AAC.1